jgi:hypothetical protein
MNGPRREQCASHRTALEGSASKFFMGVQTQALTYDPRYSLSIAAEQHGAVRGHACL